MRKPIICIIGATGTLGNKLLKFTFNNKIKINCITYFNNKKKALNLKKKIILRIAILLKTNKKKIIL
jgi:putative NADH-flavin reductase